MTNRAETITRATKGMRIAVVGDIYRLLVTGADTEGRYAMLEATVAPGSGPPMHVHTREEEGFYILEGEITFYTDAAAIRATAGDSANMPPGVKHRFRNDSDQMARMLIVVTPSGLEEMFAEAGKVLAEGDTVAPPITPEEIARIMQVAPKYGITIFPPEP